MRSIPSVVALALVALALMFALPLTAEAGCGGALAINGHCQQQVVQQFVAPVYTQQFVQPHVQQIVVQRQVVGHHQQQFRQQVVVQKVQQVRQPRVVRQRIVTRSR